MLLFKSKKFIWSHTTNIQHIGKSDVHANVDLTRVAQIPPSFVNRPTIPALPEAVPDQNAGPDGGLYLRGQDGGDWRHRILQYVLMVRKLFHEMLIKKF